MGTSLVEEGVDAAAFGRAGRVVVGRVLPGELKELPADLAAFGCAFERWAAAGTDRCGLASGGGLSWSSIDRDERVRAFDDRQGAYGLGIRDVGAAGLRLVASAEVLSDCVGRAHGPRRAVTQQIKLRIEGKPITDRLVSMFDADARPIRNGKLGKPNEFGYVLQICEVTQNTRRGARGFILPASTAPGNPPESKLPPDTAAELEHLELRPREIALDGGFEKHPTEQALERLKPDRVFITGRQQPGSRRTQRRLSRYRTGA